MNLNIQPIEKYPNEYDNLINAAEIGNKSAISNRRIMLEHLRELESNYKESIEALIDTCKELERLYGGVLYIDFLEKKTGLSWKELKQ